MIEKFKKKKKVYLPTFIYLSFYLVEEDSRKLLRTYGPY